MNNRLDRLKDIQIENLVWVILDNPGWECNHKESYTKTIHLNTKDIK